MMLGVTVGWYAETMEWQADETIRKQADTSNLYPPVYVVSRGDEIGMEILS